MREPRLGRVGKATVTLGLVTLLGLGAAALLFLLGSSNMRSLDGGLAAQPIPSFVYSRPLELRPHQGLERDAVLDALHRRGYHEAPGGKKSKREIRTGEYAVSGRHLRIARREFDDGDGTAPASAWALRFDGNGRLNQVRTEGGKTRDSVRLEPEVLGRLYGDYWQDRRPASLAQLPSSLVDAVLAIEDQRFYDHPGVDVQRIGGAFVANLRAGRIAEGGSTITQQLVKNLYLTRERSLGRKLSEALMAVEIERRLEKDEILEAYVNEVYLGQRGATAIHGVGEASRHYFGKSVTELSLPESALIAGMIRSPGLYSPHRSPEKARERRDVVLRVLNEQGRISEAERDEATAAPLVVLPRRTVGNATPFVNAWVRRLLEKEHETEAVETRGFAVRTTIDARLQRAAQKAVRNGLAKLEEEYPRLAKESPPLEAGLIALNPQTGEILAMVGGRNYSRSQFNRATQAKRQPGSAFKPVLLTAALLPDGLDPPRFTLASLLEDEPLIVPIEIRGEMEEWAPRNHDREFRGSVTLREAVEQSLNVPLARLGIDLGWRPVVRAARRLGVTSRLAAVPSLALGTSELTLLELARVYAVFASEGVRTEPYLIQSVRDRDGNLQSETETKRVRVLDKSEAYLVTSALQGVVNRGTGRRLRGMGYSGAVAGKTGTTNDYRDAWFMGYTPDLVAGVWVGFDDSRSVGLSGARAALPVFAEFLMEARGRGTSRSFETPYELDHVAVHRETGTRAGFGCPGETEVFLPGTAPDTTCGAPVWETVRQPFGWLGRVLRNGEEEPDVAAPPPRWRLRLR